MNRSSRRGEAKDTRLSLSIRDRLTLWYGLVLLAVLAAGGGAVLLLHSRLGLARIDQELGNRATTLAADLLEELEEGEPLRLRALEVVSELELPETGAAVVDASDQVLALRGLGPSDPQPADLIALRTEPVTIEHTGLGVRVRPVAHSHGEAEFRIIVWTSLAPFEQERGTLYRALWLGVPIIETQGDELWPDARDKSTTFGRRGRPSTIRSPRISANEVAFIPIAQTFPRSRKTSIGTSTSFGTNRWILLRTQPVGDCSCCETKSRAIHLNNIFFPIFPDIAMTGRMRWPFRIESRSLDAKALLRSMLTCR